jgi:TPR repeat protein
MNGDVLDKDDRQAYRWLHRAWLLREAEAVNALGVLHRDGRAGRPNAKLALALFQLAAVQATDPQSKARANRNLITLAGKLPLAERRAVACMTVREIADAIEQPMPLADRHSARLSDPRENRRLAELLPQISGGKPVACG